MLGATVPSLENRYWIFSSSSSPMGIYVPSGSLEAYKSARGWSDYAGQFIGYGFDDMEFVELTEVRVSGWSSSDGKLKSVYYEFATEGHLSSSNGSGYRLSINISAKDENTITPGYYIPCDNYYNQVGPHQFGSVHLNTINNGSNSYSDIDRGLLKVEVDAAGVYTILFDLSGFKARYVGKLN